MTFIVLLAMCLFFAVASVIMAIVLLEVYRPTTFMVLRKWRYAHSKRKEIGVALAKARAAYDNANRETQKAVAAEEHAHRVETQSVAAVARMGSYIIAEQSGEHIKAIRANNFHAKEKKIIKSIKVAEANGYSLPADERKQLKRMLQQAHEKAIKIEKERQDQAEIKAQIREEAKRQADIDRAIKQAAREERIKRQALEDAIALLGDTHSEQLETLKAELAEAQAAMQRTMSMAQQTRAGHIYVISNIGSFGRDVFKVGMTRRLEPMDRVRELGDASVPFSFDVHAMISSDDAPTLEAALHRELDNYRVNKVNPRKEYFRVPIEFIVSAVEKHHGEVQYQLDPEALEYFESIAEDDEATTLA